MEAVASPGPGRFSESLSFLCLFDVLDYTVIWGAGEIVTGSSMAFADEDTVFSVLGIQRHSQWDRQKALFPVMEHWLG